MSPEEIAITTLATTKLQLWITGLAIFLGPLTGVLFTIWFQSRKERKDAKLQIFLTLMAERKSLPVSAHATQQVGCANSYLFAHRCNGGQDKAFCPPYFLARQVSA